MPPPRRRHIGASVRCRAGSPRVDEGDVNWWSAGMAAFLDGWKHYYQDAGSEQLDFRACGLGRRDMGARSAERIFRPTLARATGTAAAEGTCLMHTCSEMNTMAKSEGDCFVVLSSRGLFWDGEGWGGREQARAFRGGPDAYADCALAVSCLRKLGVACNVAYLPRRSTPDKSNGSTP